MEALEARCSGHINREGIHPLLLAAAICWLSAWSVREGVPGFFVA